MIEQFKENFAEEQWDSLFYGKPDGKYQLDLWEANHQIMLEAGIREEHISLPNLCTCCNPEFLFSHRASHGKRGNLGAFLGIRKRNKRYRQRKWAAYRTDKNGIQPINVIWQINQHLLTFSISSMIFSLLERTFSTDTSWLMISIILARYLLIFASM